MAKRRNFKGPSIVTNSSKDFLHVPISRPSPAYTDSLQSNTYLSPKSANITDFVQASAVHKSSRLSFSRDSLIVSPDSKVSFFECGPFSAYAESFFVDDHNTSPSTAEMHDFGIYTDSMSTLNLNTPRRKCMAVGSDDRLGLPSCMTTNTYCNLAHWGGSDWRSSFFPPRNSDDSFGRSRPLSGLSSLTEVDISSGAFN